MIQPILTLIPISFIKLYFFNLLGAVLDFYFIDVCGYTLLSKPVTLAIDIILLDIFYCRCDIDEGSDIDYFQSHAYSERILEEAVYKRKGDQ